MVWSLIHTGAAVWRKIVCRYASLERSALQTGLQNKHFHSSDAKPGCKCSVSKWSKMQWCQCLLGALVFQFITEEIFIVDIVPGISEWKILWGTILPEERLEKWAWQRFWKPKVTERQGEEILNQKRNVWWAFCWNERNVLWQILQMMRGHLPQEGERVSMHAVHQETSFMLLSCRMLPCQMTSHRKLKSYLLPVTFDSIFFILFFSPSSHLTHDRY